MTEDIRWKQRFQNYRQALQTLSEAIQLAQQRPLSKLEKQGLIQGFEFTHELGWNVLKDRNLSSHTYNLELAERMVQDIAQRYYPAFVALAATLDQQASETP
jgi:hypothetical protein